MTDKYCNKALIYETSSELRIPEKQVKDLISFFTQQITIEIKSGAMNGVMVPYLGKFQIKHDNLQYKEFFDTLTPDMQKIFNRKEDKRDRMSIFFKPQEKE